MNPNPLPDASESAIATGRPLSRSRRLRLVLFAFATTCPLLAAHAADWPQFRGPDLNGISAETNWFAPWPDAGPRIAWRTNVGTGFSSCAIRNGRLYTMGNTSETDTVFCLDAASGTLVWKHAYPAPLDAKYYEGGPSATPTLDAGWVYTLSKRGRVWALDAADGRVRWEQDVTRTLNLQVNEWGFAGSPRVVGDLLILNVGGAGTALNKRTGQVAWSSGPATAGYASPVPFGPESRPSIALFTAKHLVAADAATGREHWRFPWETGYDNNNADPIIDGNRFFISTYDRGCALLAVHPDGPVVVYTNASLHTHMSAAIKWGDYLYGMNGREGRGRPNDFRCVAFATGAVQWSTRGLGVGSLTASADGKLVILSETGELVIAQASPSAFQPLARAQILGGRCWTPPVLAHGRIYARNARGDLVCVEVGPPRPGEARP